LALWVLCSGHSALYIAPNIRWTLWLAIIASLGIAALDGAAAWERGERLKLAIPWKQVTPGAILLFAPFAAGIAISPATLGAGSILAHDGVIALIGPPQPASSEAIRGTGESTLVQLQYRAQRGALVTGETVSVRGFAFSRPGLPPGSWLLVRFVTPHCVAEAQPVGLLIRPGQGSTIRAPPDNAWVSVSGSLAAASVDSKTSAVLDMTTLTKIAIPPDPYLVY
jgi:uncharacterized repeat protein (TIGR03943 family)